MNFIYNFIKLRNYCQKEQFKGWDPYDGLNSKLFQTLPLLKNSAICRLIIIQGFKRFFVTFVRKDNSLRINRLVGLHGNWVTR